MKQSKKFYATLCLMDGNHYVTVNAENREEARAKMFREYGERWAFLYDEDEKYKIDAHDTTKIAEIA